MNKCLITDLPIQPIDSMSYKVNFDNREVLIRKGYTLNHFANDSLFKKNKHLFAGAFFTNQYPIYKEDGIGWIPFTSDVLKTLLPKIQHPKTPQSKIDSLLTTIYRLQKFEGEKIRIVNYFQQPEFYYKHFFRSQDECKYYISILDKLGYLECIYQDTTNNPIDCTMTLEGLNHYLKLSEEGQLSNKCFVAMSFGQDMEEIRDSIKQSIINNNFEPVLIDEQLIESTQTINDAIIAAIKSCKFCIADFTQQKDGVYFESGFAAGLGKPVIYTCHKDWFEKSHFDTNHFPHIIYNNKAQLIEMLNNKIKAWITS